MSQTTWIAAALQILAVRLIAGSVEALPGVIATLSGVLWLNESDPLGAEPMVDDWRRDRHRAEIRSRRDHLDAQ
jgi:hypothetical protein